MQHKLTFLTLAGALVLTTTAASSDKPNVIFILADDLGWADTTLYGHTTLYQTPNLERLAKRGMVFSRAYSASPLCSPTRSSILTGQTAARTGFTAPSGHAPKAVLRATVREKGGAGNKAQPEKVRELDALIEKHLRDSHAVTPQPNPAFDPAQYHPERIGKQPGGLKVGGDDNPKASKKGAKAKAAAPKAEE